MADPTLSKKDLRNSGDGLITFDSATQLEWLDLSETRNLSYNQVSNNLQPGGSLQGWSYATFDQVNNLYKKFGFANGVTTYGENNPAFVASWNDLVSFISNISSSSGGVSSFYGLINDLAAQGGYVGFVKNTLNAGGGVLGYENHDRFQSTSSDPSLASFLVRLAAGATPSAPTGLSVGN